MVKRLALHISAWLPAVIAAAGLSLTAGFVLSSDLTRLDSIEVVQSEGSSPILFERIRNSLQPELKKQEGRRIWNLSLRKLRTFVRKDRRVKDVAIQREFPGRVKVIVEPYSPVLAFLDSDNKIYPVANDATLLPAVSSQEGFDVPILRGESLRENLELREQALKLLEQLPVAGPISQATVSEIVYSKGEGFKVFLSQVNSEVKLGDTDFGLKVSRVEKVLAYLENQNIKSRVIDARFSKKVVVRARNAP